MRLIYLASGVTAEIAIAKGLGLPVRFIEPQGNTFPLEEKI
jgi:hypothetical protein